jgi:site-specific DNA-methyltransferase (adenine-specific)
MIPYFQTPSVTLYNRECLAGLRELPDQSVQTCVTSPPYFGLRDYGNPEQIGLEPTPDLFVAKMVEVFREVKRVLRNDGTLWLNLGDSYASSSSAGDKVFGNPEFNANRPSRAATKTAAKTIPPGLKPKDLIGIPWRVAFALQADGWYLRQDIIWAKPNPMPESVGDRCTKAHEYIFLLSKSPRYFYDSEAVKEQSFSVPQIRLRSNGVSSEDQGKRIGFGNLTANCGVSESRNRRSVWSVATQPYAEAHFATFPPDLITPCILAGSPVDGVVLDPFSGSGTTLQVAKDLGRKAIGFELNPDYCKLIAKRCQQLTIFDALGA